MKRTFKSPLLWLWACVAIGIMAIRVESARTDIITLQGSGSYWGKDVIGVNSSGTLYFNNSSESNVFTVTSSGVGTFTSTVTVSGDLRLTDENIILGAYGTAISTTNTAASSRGTILHAYLKDGGTEQAAAVEGSVICSTSPSSSAGNSVTVFVCPTTLDLTSWIGVAAAAASTGTVVQVYTSGWVLALTTGTVSSGDTLVTTATARGYLGTDTTPTTGADVGVALGPGTSAGGLTRIRLR